MNKKKTSTIVLVALLAILVLPEVAGVVILGGALAYLVYKRVNRSE